MTSMEIVAAMMSVVAGHLCRLLRTMVTHRTARLLAARVLDAPADTRADALAALPYLTALMHSRSTSHGKRRG